MSLLRVAISIAASTVATVAALPVLILSLPLLLVARATARLGRALEVETVAWHEAITYEPELGWRAKPGLDAHVRDFNGDPFHVTTDPAGFRGPGALDDADIIVFGDSFAFGSGIDSRRFFANLPGDVAIKTVGAPGYNMVQSLLWMRRLAGSLDGKLVVWLVYPANDLDDNVLPAMGPYRIPFVRPDSNGWAIEVDHIAEKSWPFSLPRRNVERYVDICTGREGTERLFDACEWLISRAAETCTGAGARLIVVSVPDLSPLNTRAVESALETRADRDRFDATVPSERLREICKENAVSFFALSEVLEVSDYLERDVHWTERGHKRVREALVNLWKANLESEWTEQRAEPSHIRRQA